MKLLSLESHFIGNGMRMACGCQRLKSKVKSFPVNFFQVKGKFQVINTEVEVKSQCKLLEAIVGMEQYI